MFFFNVVKKLCANS